jgi:hypothetical protein
MGFDSHLVHPEEKEDEEDQMQEPKTLYHPS